MSDRIKILFALRNFTTAGSGREMFNIVERLDKTVFEPWIAVEKEGGALLEEIRSKGYPVLVKPFIAESKPGIMAKVKSARAYAAAFRPYKFQIWQSFHWSSDFTEALVARWAGAKYVYVKKNMNWNRMAWKVKSLLSAKVIARNTDLMQKHFSPRLYKNKAIFVTGGVQVDKFKPGRSLQYRLQNNIPEDGFLITCIAQMIKVKDQLTLIKAVARMEGAHLILAGATRDEAYLNEVKTLIADLNLKDRVIIAGSVSNVNELLNAADVYVLPTGMLFGHEEGCPVALLEAMAAGTPCIASDVAGSRDLIINGETGLLFSPGNVEQLVNCLEKYRSNKAFANQMAEAALKQVHAFHTLETEGKAFSDVYRNMVAKR